MVYSYRREYMQATDTYGAVERSRTSDLLITNQLLYQLSYNSLGRNQDNYVNYNLLENGGQTFPILRAPRGGGRDKGK